MVVGFRQDYTALYRRRSSIPAFHSFQLAREPSRNEKLPCRLAPLGLVLAHLRGTWRVQTHLDVGLRAKAIE